MTAFYMFRLVSLTFFGPYRGPTWEVAGHGPHEAPAAMTMPLMVLAVGAIVAGFVGIPAALGGGNAIEQFLEPSFTVQQASLLSDAAEAARLGSSAEQTGASTAGGVQPPPDHGVEAEHAAEPHASGPVELGLMLFSVVIALIGMGLAWKFYVTSPEISDRLASRLAGAHQLLSNKYYVDELYDATVISGTMAGARGMWTVDRKVVDGAVNGTGWVTIISSWFSGLTDRTVVDGLVNLLGWFVQEGSHLFRRLQTGLVQNYAMLMLFGIFAFISIYLIFVR
jgi:NADH-quinone oxidoreductase subunit L